LGRTINLEKLVHELLYNIKYYFNVLESNGEELLNSKYDFYLFRKDKPSTFQLPDETLFTGIIRGVTASGELQLQTEDALKTYGLKELSLLY
jgi:BirA family biotin operon repressor/biotin-[acetyl-CoA-carboxylase] ligase